MKEKMKEGNVSKVRDKHYALVSTAGRNKEHVANAYISLLLKKEGMQRILSSGQTIVLHRTRTEAFTMPW